jgi:hypothetical protein
VLIADNDVLTTANLFLYKKKIKMMMMIVITYYCVRCVRYCSSRNYTLIHAVIKIVSKR